jgi:hypothetical protein
MLLFRHRGRDDEKQSQASHLWLLIQGDEGAVTVNPDPAALVLDTDGWLGSKRSNSR